MSFEHISVMLHEAVDMLDVRPGGIYVDGTLGGGGHSGEILRRLGGTGRLYGIDRDRDALRPLRSGLAMRAISPPSRAIFTTCARCLPSRGWIRSTA